MNIANQTAESLSVILDPEEAQHLVEGLSEHLPLLGQPAEKLLNLLVGAGVRAPQPAGHVRTEYMPPLR
ncbi:MAG: hypothetical protein ACYDHY_10770 [Acidiferrobacterales bacterium]